MRKAKIAASDRLARRSRGVMVVEVLELLGEALGEGEVCEVTLKFARVLAKAGLSPIRVR